MGADYVEPDLVSTKDSVLVARHENEIGGTTDVAVRFPDRRRTQTIDGVPVTGWFTEDFTPGRAALAARGERLPMRSRAHDGQFGGPDVRRGAGAGRAPVARAGAPDRRLSRDQAPEPLPGDRPAARGAARGRAARARARPADAPVFVQSFEVGNLERLAGMTRVPLVQLMGGEGAPPDRAAGPGATTYAAMATPEGLRRIARYARGIGAEKRMVQPIDSAGRLLAPTTLVRDAHAAGLVVHVWTMRSDAQFLPRAYGGDAAAEWRRFAELGVDGVFGDFPDVGVAARGDRRP
jgi:glycerophosphoryl diester phosphodiesterase